MIKRSGVATFVKRAIFRLLGRAATSGNPSRSLTARGHSHCRRSATKSVQSQESDSCALWKGLNLHERRGSDLAFYRYRHWPRRWQIFGRSVNYNPLAAGRGPDFVPAGNGAAYVFETGCPSLVKHRRTLVQITEAWTAGLEDVRRSFPAGTKSGPRPAARGL